MMNHKPIYRSLKSCQKKVPLFGIQRFGITQMDNPEASTIRLYEASEDTGEIITRTLEKNPLTEQRRKRERSQSDAEITVFFEEAKRAKKADEGDAIITRLGPR